MSMVMEFQMLSDAEIDDLLARPEHVHDLLDREEIEESRTAYLDEAWHVIHYLLCGTAQEGEGPLTFILAGGDDVGEEDVGYGPARVFRSEAAIEIEMALRSVDMATMLARFDAPAMDAADVYPEAGNWSLYAPPDGESLDYFLEPFRDLKAFFRRSAETGKGFIVALS